MVLLTVPKGISKKGFLAIRFHNVFGIHKPSVHYIFNSFGLEDNQGHDLRHIVSFFFKESIGFSM